MFVVDVHAARKERKRERACKRVYDKDKDDDEEEEEEEEERERTRSVI